MVSVLMLSHYYYPHIGGNEGQCKMLAETLQLHGIQIAVVTKKFRNGLPSFEIINGVKTYRVFCLSSLLITPMEDTLLNNKQKRGLLTLLYRIWMRFFFYLDEFLFVLLAVRKLIRLKKGFDLIHVHQAHWIAFCGAIASRIIRKPVLVKDATFNGLKEMEIMPFAGFMKKIVKRTACFAAISSDIKENLLLEGVKESKIYFIPNGVRLSDVSNSYPSNNYDILFVGNFNQGKIKGIDILLQAFPIVAEKYPTAKLFILGTGNSSKYSTLLSGDGRMPCNIEFMGRKDTTEFYKKCRVFVLPSRSEGMSNALLEAMSYGMPCVSTKVSGSKDLIVDGYNGLLIEKDNITELANALLYLFSNSDTMRKLGENARNVIADQYQMDHIARKYREIYKHILETF